jgi:hypothetical protein
MRRVGKSPSKVQSLKYSTDFDEKKLESVSSPLYNLTRQPLSSSLLSVTTPLSDSPLSPPTPPLSSPQRRPQQAVAKEVEATRGGSHGDQGWCGARPPHTSTTASAAKVMRRSTSTCFNHCGSGHKRWWPRQQRPRRCCSWPHCASTMAAAATRGGDHGSDDQGSAALGLLVHRRRRTTQETAARTPRALHQILRLPRAS